jgi:spermidine synthase
MSQTSDHRREHLAVHLVIFLAGFTFLIYEVSWNRLLSLVLGATVTASTIVLAAFMAGFGTGAFYWGRTANRSIKPGALLAALLGGIGLFSALDYLLITRAIPSLYSSLSGGGFSSGLTELIVFGAAGGFLFVPAFLIGGIFPIATGIAVRSDDAIASSLGRLYAVETLGSSVGGLATGFVFLGMLGQMSTVGLAVVIDLILAVWLLLTGMFNQVEQPAISESPSDAEPRGTAPRKSRRGHPATPATFKQVALVGAFVCGLAMLSLQVLWIRMFRIYFTNTSYTFALVASLVILGLFVGSLLFKRWGHNIDNPAQSMLRVILLIGASTALGLLLLIYLPEIIMFPLQAAFSDPLARILLLPLIASLLIVFPPAVFSGYAFPLACRMYTSGSCSIGKDVGFVLMVNTIGCVIGPIMAAFLLMPLLGAVASVVLILVLLAGAALYVLHRSAAPHATKLARTILYIVAAGMVVAIIMHPEVRILPPSFSQFDREVLFYHESVEGTLSVGQDRGNQTGSRYTYVNNSAVIGSTYDAVKVVKMVGHYPFLLGGERKKVLVIGFGIGVTTSAIASHPEVESIECVELAAGLKDAAVYYRDLNRSVAEDPRLKIISGDGRHYLQLTSNTYDLISCDPTHPILGSGNLYTKEYFALCRQHLNPGGVVSQYLPLHKLRTEELLGIISTFHSIFPNCTVWLGHNHAVLLGALEPIQIDFKQWITRVNELGQDPHFYIEPYHLAAMLALDGPTIERLGAKSKINSDDHSYTEFFAPACLDEDNLPKNLRFLMDNRTKIDAVFTNIDDPEKMARFAQGNQLLTESLLYQMSGDNQRSLQSLREAIRVNPEDQEYPFLIRLNQ